MINGRGRSLAMGALTILTAIGCGPGPADGDVGPVIAVDPGLAPTRSPAQVAGIVLERIRGDEALVGRPLAPPRILRMSVTTSDRAREVEPNAGTNVAQGGGERPSIVWVVRAQGTFATQRDRGPLPLSAASGYYVIADADGSIVEFGFP